MAKSPEEAIRKFLEEVTCVDKLYPETDQEIVFYRRYRIALDGRPDGMLPCHACQEQRPRNPPSYISETRMGRHCKIFHPKASIECSHRNCTVHFISNASKEAHELYCHIKPYGWWIC